MPKSTSFESYHWLYEGKLFTVIASLSYGSAAIKIASTL